MPRRKALPYNNPYDKGEWAVTHIHSFCNPEEGVCDHEAMVLDFDDLFNHLDKACKPNNDWRPRQPNLDLRSKHKCIVCICDIRWEDFAIGIFKQYKWNLKKKAFIMHDTCLARMFGSGEEKVTAVMKERLVARPNFKKEIEKFCVFEGSSICLACRKGNGAELRTREDKVVLNCNDIFCSVSYHFACALRSNRCIVDLNDEKFYCKEHIELHTGINDVTQRGIPCSQSPTTYENCAGCRLIVHRWPIRREIFNMACCGTFMHSRCVRARLKKGVYNCPCGDQDKFLASLHKQGLYMMQYRAKMREQGILRIKRLEDCFTADAEAKRKEDEKEMYSEEEDEDDYEDGEEEEGDVEEEGMRLPKDEIVDIISSDEEEEKMRVKRTKGNECIEVSSDDDIQVLSSTINRPRAKKAKLMDGE